jgi:hypothetical protein
MVRIDKYSVLGTDLAYDALRERWHRFHVAFSFNKNHQSFRQFRAPNYTAV